MNHLLQPLFSSVSVHLYVIYFQISASKSKGKYKLCGGMNYKSKYGVLFFTLSVPEVFLGVVPMASNQISLYKISDIYFNKTHRFSYLPNPIESVMLAFSDSLPLDRRRLYSRVQK